MDWNDLLDRRNELAAQLLDKRNPEGFWEGQLSSSALGVAVAVTALHFDNQAGHQEAIRSGTDWLVGHQNADGGFGDSPESLSNISTSLLVYAAFHIRDGQDAGLGQARDKLSEYLKSHRIDIHSPAVADAILAHYQTDYTFSVPILTMCALCGVPAADAFRKIPQLPFEFSLLPRSFYRVLKLSVVSYAIPALIAVGIAIFSHKKSRNPIVSWLRKKAVQPALRLLHTLMPESGGFLEAIPLTGFVSMCLIASGYGHLDVVRKGIRFLQSTQRNDGSWAIDVDLSTWVTSLSVKSLIQSGNVTEKMSDRDIRTDDLSASEASAPGRSLSVCDQERLTAHYLGQQYTTVHPFNGALPGGWGWTNHTGSVPDGDDTPGAIIALVLLNAQDPGKIRNSVLSGCYWLLNLQNRDGGFPTFVKGWGKLPFDQSCADLTGHGLLALSMTLEVFEQEMPRNLADTYRNAIRRGMGYLMRNQRNDGALLPLWFGNQQAAGHLNPVYGTARVLTYLNDMAGFRSLEDSIRRDVTTIAGNGRAFLVKVRNPDGSWGGDAGVGGTIEETSLALGALAGSEYADVCTDALQWLNHQYATAGLVSSPIGLYFASLWYGEVLYPHTAYLEGLSRYLHKSAAARQR